jgi:hypothetical protein
MRYVIYDKSTGVILHTHQSFKFGSEEPQEVGEDDIRGVLGRFPETEKVDLVMTTAPQVSSRQAEMSVDLKTGEVVANMLIDDALSRRLAELHGKTTKKAAKKEE